MWMVAAFLAVPLIEIALFIQVGGWLTLWPTLAIVVLTAVAGAALVRRQGTAVLDELRTEGALLRDPVSPLAHGAMILFAGALLLTPGFFTDAVGFALLVPALRRRVIALVAARMTVVTAGPGRRPATGEGVIDGDFVVLDPEPQDGTRREPPAGGGSGWTRH